MEYNVIDTGMAYENDRVFGVYEVPTQQVIAVSVGKKLLKDIAHGLNMGKGFDGNTPAFFMNGRPQIIPKEDEHKWSSIT